MVGHDGSHETDLVQSWGSGRNGCHPKKLALATSSHTASGITVKSVGSTLGRRRQCGREGDFLLCITAGRQSNLMLTFRRTCGKRCSPIMSHRSLRVATCIAICAWRVLPLAAQENLPALRAGGLNNIVIDGALIEAAWTTAELIDTLIQIEPTEGAQATGRTVVRVLADRRSLVIGVVCEYPDDVGIVSFSVRRDASLNAEEHVRIVLGPFADGRSGYVFAVNPTGARYDGLINPGGESENADWDGIWEAATTRLPTGWSVEIRIPVQTLSF